MDWTNAIIALTPIATLTAVWLNSFLTSRGERLKRERDQKMQIYRDFYVPTVKWLYKLGPYTLGISVVRQEELAKWDYLDELITDQIHLVSEDVLNEYIQFINVRGGWNDDHDISIDMLNMPIKEYTQNQNKRIEKQFIRTAKAILKEADTMADKLKLPSIGKPLYSTLPDIKS